MGIPSEEPTEVWAIPSNLNIFKQYSFMNHLRQVEALGCKHYSIVLPLSLSPSPFLRLSSSMMRTAEIFCRLQSPASSRSRSTLDARSRLFLGSSEGEIEHWMRSAKDEALYQSLDRQSPIDENSPLRSFNRADMFPL